MPNRGKDVCHHVSYKEKRNYGLTINISVNCYPVTRGNTQNHDILTYTNLIIFSINSILF